MQISLRRLEAGNIKQKEQVTKHDNKYETEKSTFIDYLRQEYSSSSKN